MRSENEVRSLLEKLKIVERFIDEDLLLENSEDFCLICFKLADEDCYGKHYIIQTTDIPGWIDALEWVLGKKIAGENENFSQFKKKLKK